MEAASLLHPISQEMLTPVVREVLNRPTAQIVGWEQQPLGGSYGGATAGLYRIAGTATDQAEMHSWSLILKVLTSVRRADRWSHHAADPSQPDYWRREALVYQSDMLADLPDGFAIPRCYSVREEPDSAWLWLEDIADGRPGRWSVAQYARAARHFGRFNGFFLASRPLPNAPWLVRQLIPLRTTGTTEQTFDRLASLRHDHALVREVWPEALEQRVRRLCTERAPLLSALARVPQTLRHGDSVRGNLLARFGQDGTDETVVIDWALLGIDAVGDDLTGLMRSSIFGPRRAGAEHLAQLDEACFEGYVQGLEDVGWRGDIRLVRLGFTTAVALRYGLMPLLFEPGLQDEQVRSRAETIFGQSLEESLRQGRIIREFALDCADEARQLMEKLFRG